MGFTEDEVQEIISAVRKSRRAKKFRRIWGESVLLRFGPELRQLQHGGMSTRDLAEYMLTEHQVKVSHTTVWRFLGKEEKTCPSEQS